MFMASFYVPYEVQLGSVINFRDAALGMERKSGPTAFLRFVLSFDDVASV